MTFGPFAVDHLENFHVETPRTVNPIPFIETGFRGHIRLLGTSGDPGSSGFSNAGLL
jgi:hypothetical protein